MIMIILSKFCDFKNTKKIILNRHKNYNLIPSFFALKLYQFLYSQNVKNKIIIIN